MARVTSSPLCLTCSGLGQEDRDGSDAFPRFQPSMSQKYKSGWHSYPGLPSQMAAVLSFTVLALNNSTFNVCGVTHWVTDGLDVVSVDNPHPLEFLFPHNNMATFHYYIGCLGIGTFLDYSNHSLSYSHQSRSSKLCPYPSLLSAHKTDALIYASRSSPKTYMFCNKTYIVPVH